VNPIALAAAPIELVASPCDRRWFDNHHAIGACGFISIRTVRKLDRSCARSMERIIQGRILERI